MVLFLQKLSLELCLFSLLLQIKRDVVRRLIHPLPATIHHLGVSESPGRL